MRNTLKTNILTVLALSMLTAAGCTARDITPAEEPEVILSREEEILEGMSLTEKIEQMMVISLRYSGYDDES